ncbi:MAG: flagellum-specific ATP synthase FliI, partial [Gammaproteobacteria bacterium]
GHIVLSRHIAESGHYPAIDIEASISRVMNDIVSKEHQQAAQRFKQLYSIYNQHRDLISVGAYQPGSDPRVDEAVTLQPALSRFLRQDMGESHLLKPSIAELQKVVAGT